LEVRFWTDSRRSDFVSTASRVRSRIPHALEREEIGLPDGVLRIARADERKRSVHEALKGRG
jgi:small-conductance mechanosensitive channel